MNSENHKLFVEDMNAFQKIQINGLLSRSKFLNKLLLFTVLILFIGLLLKLGGTL